MARAMDRPTEGPTNQPTDRPSNRTDQTEIFKMKEKSYIKGSICYINNKCILFTPIRKLWMFFFLTPIYENESIFFLAALVVLYMLV